MKFRIKVGDIVSCPECREPVLVCVTTPLPGARVSNIVTTCFKGVSYPVYATDTPKCDHCKEGIYYKPGLGFFTKKYGWSW